MSFSTLPPLSSAQPSSSSASIAATTNSAYTSSPSQNHDAQSISTHGPSATTSVSSPASNPQAHLHPHLPSTTPSTTNLSPSLPSQSPTTSTHPSSPTSTPDSVALARRAVVASISNVLDRELTSRASAMHANAAAISKQQRDVEKATAGLKKENDKLAKVARDGAKKVKELGDVQNWAEMLEKDFLVLGETLRMVREGSGSESGSWTGSEWSGSEDGDEDREEGGLERVGDGNGDDVVMGNGNADGLDLKPLDKGKGKEVMVDDPVPMDIDAVPDTAEALEPASETCTAVAVDAAISTDLPRLPQPGLATQPSEAANDLAEDNSAKANVAVQ